MPKLTKETRDALPDIDFAVNRELPIHDEQHVRFAWANVDNTKGLSAAERHTAHFNIIARAAEFKMALKQPWNVTLEAMALNISNSGHPNKMPFSGVLTRIDKPSDAAPDGSGGKLITISAEAAEKGLQSLLGMAVNYKSTMDGHDPRAKVGIISAATIEGDAINIEGFIYANDYPDVAAEIKASKDVLGFSYECRDIYTNNPDANPVVITDCTFTGAAILLKAKAAYRSTSLQASAEKEFVMDKEVEKMFTDLTAGQVALTAALATITASVEKLGPISAANLLSKIEPHAAKLEAAADKMESEGIGGDANNGHAVVLRKMAGSMRAEAAQGRMPSSWSFYAAADKIVVKEGDGLDTAKAIADAVKPFADQVAAMGTKIADLTAAARADVKAPERKTVKPEITALLAKGGIDVGALGDAKIEVAKLDGALKEFGFAKRLEIKAALSQAGML